MTMRKLLLGLPVMAAIGFTVLAPTPAHADSNHRSSWSDAWRHDHHPQRHQADNHPRWSPGKDGGHPWWGQDDHRWSRDGHRWADADHAHARDDYRNAAGRNDRPAPWWASPPWWSHH
jgi:hypothetical protein